MVTGLSDFFIRRTGLMYFDPELMLRLLPATKLIFQKLLGWSDLETDRQGKAVLEEWKRLSKF